MSADFGAVSCNYDLRLLVGRKRHASVPQKPVSRMQLLKQQYLLNIALLLTTTSSSPDRLNLVSGSVPNPVPDLECGQTDRTGPF